jgi:carbamoyl-phosphate synthase large subunit
MGIDSTFGRAFFKAELSAGNGIPSTGTVFLSVNDRDKPAGLIVAQRMRERGLSIVATRGTAEYLGKFGLEVDRVLGKVQDADGGQTAVDLIADGTIKFVVNTPRGSVGRSDGEHIRKAASMHRVSCVTTLSAALAAAQGMGESPEQLPVRSLQEFHSSGASSGRGAEISGDGDRDGDGDGDGGRPAGGAQVGAGTAAVAAGES